MDVNRRVIAHVYLCFLHRQPSIWQCYQPIVRHLAADNTFKHRYLHMTCHDATATFAEATSPTPVIRRLMTCHPLINPREGRGAPSLAVVQGYSFERKYERQCCIVYSGVQAKGLRRFSFFYLLLRSCLSAGHKGVYVSVPVCVILPTSQREQPNKPYRWAYPAGQSSRVCSQGS